MNMATQVQNLHKAVYIFPYTDTLGKGMNLTIPSSAMAKL